jgi:S-adenosylmethionine hydrolase
VRWILCGPKRSGGSQLASLLFEDSDGRLCLALNQASAAERLGVSEGDRILIRAA